MRASRGLAPALDLHYRTSLVLTTRFALALALSALAGCDEQANAGTPDASIPAPPTPTSTAPSTSTARPTASATPAASGEFKVLGMVFTTEVKNKAPVDKLDAAAPGQRVYMHVTARNRTDATKPITLAFTVAGAERSKIDLKVDPSWSYRTWGYVTLRDTDVGELVATVRDDAGNAMERARIPIKGEPAKPQKK